jgi:KDO2-lipid IV(A) lauroyltransferase
VARRRSKILDFLVYLIVQVSVRLIQTAPWNFALKLADGLAWLAYHVDVRHRRIALENLHHAFPSMCPREADRIVRGVYRHFCEMIVEITKTPRVLNPWNLGQYIHYETDEEYRRVLDLLLSNRPLIFLTGHLGNWELYSYATGLFGVHMVAVARPLDNVYLDRFLRRFRRASGHRLADKNGDYDLIQQTLEQGGYLGLVGDQDAGQKGMFVNFFGRPASTFKSIALLSLEYRAPIVVAAGVRVGRPMRYSFRATEMIFPEEYETQPDAVRQITQRYTTALEDLVKQYPEQYLWLHRRWKHQPKARKKSAAA